MVAIRYLGLLLLFLVACAPVQHIPLKSAPEAPVVQINSTDAVTEDAVDTVYRDINIYGTKGAFIPDLIKAQQGEWIRLNIQAVDRDYDFSLPAYDVQRVLVKGEPMIIAFRADKPGKHAFFCYSRCAPKYTHMSGTLIVE